MSAEPAGPTGTAVAPDGTPLAYWRSGPPAGSARPLLLVHGTTSDHTTYDELVPHAAATRPVYTWDRRGRGRSGDGSGAYDIDLEHADAAAVVDEVARLEGSDVDVLGHSFGAFVALGALPLTSAVHAAVAYSPGFGGTYPEGALDALDQAVASGDLDAALRVVFRDIIGMTEDDIETLSQSPTWPVRTELAWSVGRECRADMTFLDDHLAVLQSITTPLTVVTGATNTPAKRLVATRVADAVPGAVLVELAGQAHTAHHAAPDALLRAAYAAFDAVP